MTVQVSRLDPGGTKTKYRCRDGDTRGYVTREKNTNPKFESRSSILSFVSYHLLLKLKPSFSVLFL